MADTHDQYPAIFVHDVDDEMRLEGVNAHRRRYLAAFARQFRIFGKKLQHRSQVAVTSLGMRLAEKTHTFKPG